MWSTEERVAVTVEEATAGAVVELVALSAAEPEWIRPAVGSPALPVVDVEGVQDAPSGRLAASSSMA